jgi:HSP20 family protein
MKGSTLRTVKKDDPSTIPVEKGVTSGEGRVSTRDVTMPTVFDRMERLMGDMFRGELWGRLGTPLDRLFHEVGLGGEGGIKVDVFEEGGSLVVKADLPGIAKEDLSVRVIEGTLLISGERRHEEKVERKNYLRVERSIGTFSRTIPLPEGVNTEGITATLKDGILDIRIPRLEVKKPVVHIDIA